LLTYSLQAEICAKCGKKYYRDYEVPKKGSDEEEDESEGDEDSHLTGRSWYHFLRNELLEQSCFCWGSDGWAMIRTTNTSEQEGCDGALRDTIVHFGEGFEEDVFAEAVAKSKEADLTLCLGTLSSYLFVSFGCVLMMANHRLEAVGHAGVRHAILLQKAIRGA
jgi:NAD-dependent SIR2 family protein deacetylase